MPALFNPAHPFPKVIPSFRIKASREDRGVSLTEILNAAFRDSIAYQAPVREAVLCRLKQGRANWADLTAVSENACPGIDSIVVRTIIFGLRESGEIAQFGPHFFHRRANVGCLIEIKDDGAVSSELIFPNTYPAFCLGTIEMIRVNKGKPVSMTELEEQFGSSTSVWVTKAVTNGLLRKNKRGGRVYLDLPVKSLESYTGIQKQIQH